MRQRNSRSRVRDTTLLSGWLFADLLLGLAIIFMVSAPRGLFAPVPPTLTPTPVPTYTSFPTQTPLPTHTPGPSQTPLPTHTPGPTQTPFPTYTPGPTQTPLPTFTPYPTWTPGPTWTPVDTATAGPSPSPQPTYTPYPTFTPQPTWTPDPTYTPLPTLTPRPTSTPINVDGRVLSQQPTTIRFATDIDALIGTDGTARTREQERLRDVIRREFGGLQGQRAGIVLTFGFAPSPADGGRLSREVNALLRSTLPDIFGEAVFRNFHRIEGDPQLRGVVEVEIYLIAGGP